MRFISKNITVIALSVFFQIPMVSYANLDSSCIEHIEFVSNYLDRNPPKNITMYRDKYDNYRITEIQNSGDKCIFFFDAYYSCDAIRKIVYLKVEGIVIEDEEIRLETGGWCDY